MIRRSGVTLAAWVAFAAACGGKSHGGDTDCGIGPCVGDGDSDADADSDGDGDGDSEGDADADADADGDADGDGDADVDDPFALCDPDGGLLGATCRNDRNCELDTGA